MIPEKAATEVEGNVLPTVASLHRHPTKALHEAIKLDKLVLLFTIPLLVALSLFVFRTPLDRLAGHLADEGAVLGFNLRECSGNGLVAANGACFCDAGFAGTDCALRVPVGQPVAVLNDLPSRRLSAALFVDTVASVSGSAERDSNVYLAQALARAGIDVTVYTTTRLALGDDDGDNRITVERVPGLPGSTAAASVAVYHDLMTRNHPFDVIYFDANSHDAFHTVAAAALGTRCIPSRLVVGVTHPGTGTDVENDLRDRTISLADHVVFASEELRNAAAATGNHKDAEVAPLLTSGAQKSRTPPLAVIRPPRPARELVYVGDGGKGLAMFLDAIDRLRISPPSLQITIFGPVAGAAAQVSASAERWPKYAVEVRDAPLTPSHAVTYLTDAAHTRVAVVPDVTRHAQIAQELAMSGTPVIRGVMGENAVEALADQLAHAIDAGIAGESVAELEAAQHMWVETVLRLAKGAPVSCDGRLHDHVNPSVAVVVAHPRGTPIERLRRAVAVLEEQDYPALEVVVTSDPGAEDAATAEVLQGLASAEWTRRGWKLIMADAPATPTIAQSADELIRAGIQVAQSEYVVPMLPHMIAKQAMLEVFARAASATKVDALIAGVDSTVSRRRTLPLPPGVASPTRRSRAAWSGVFMARKTMLSAAGGFSSDIRALLAKMQMHGARVEAVPEAVAIIDAEHAFIAREDRMAGRSDQEMTTLSRRALQDAHLASRQAQESHKTTETADLSSTSAATTAPSSFAHVRRRSVGASVNPSELIVPTPTRAAPTATLVVLAPTLLAACDNSSITIDLSKSAASDGSTLSYYYYVDQGSGTTAAVTAALATANGTQGSVALPASAVTVGNPLTVGVSVAISSAPNGTVYSPRQLVTVARSASSTIPQLALSNSIFRGRMADTLTQYMAVTFAACSGLNASAVPFNSTWNVTDPNGDAVDISAVGGTVTGRNLKLPLSQLVTVYTISAPFSVVPVPFAAFIMRGSTQMLTTSRSNGFAAVIRDADNLAGTKTYTYRWIECEDNVCHEASTRQSFPYPANSLTPGKTFDMYVQVTDSSTNPPRFAQAQGRFITTSDPTPYLDMSWQPPLSAANPAQGVSVLAEFRHPDYWSPFRLKSVEWSISPSLAQGVDLRATVTKEFASLVIGRDVLQACQQFTFRVTGTMSPDTLPDITFMGEITVPIAAPPAGGIVSVVNTNAANMVNNNPASGVAFTDTFCITTSGWTNGTSPFTYAFGYSVAGPGNGDLVPNNVALTTIPTVNAITLPMAARNVYVVVTDANGASATAVQPVTLVRGVGAMATSNTAVLDTATTMLAAARADSPINPTAALATLSAISAMTADLPSSLSVADRTQVAALTASVLNATAAAMSILTPQPETALRALSVINTIDLRSASASDHDAYLALIDTALVGLRVTVAGVPKSLDVRNAQLVARALDNALQAQLASSSIGLLRRRQTGAINATATQQRIFGQVRALVLASLAGESTLVPSVPTYFTTPSFSASGRRIRATSSESGDAPRNVNTFAFNIVQLFGPGCLDLVTVDWPTMHGSGAPAANMVAHVLSVHAFQCGLNVPEDATLFNITYSTVIPSGGMPANHGPVCVYWSGTAWTNAGCTTTLDAAPTPQVTCKCPIYSEFSVQAQPGAAWIPSTPPSSTPSNSPGSGAPGGGAPGGGAPGNPPGTPTPDQTGAIAGGSAVGALALVGAGFGIFAWRRRSAASARARVQPEPQEEKSETVPPSAEL
ncbi:hypothetical protein GGF31_004507 [Allomyces arbusculus]|nr:hypothetical protein GGF31_004507 [Allomyces arbusculus]